MIGIRLSTGLASALFAMTAGLFSSPVAAQSSGWKFSENNNHVEIGKEGYFLSADGHLMPTRKDQPPPVLRYFKPTKK